MGAFVVTAVADIRGKNEERAGKFTGEGGVEVEEVSSA